MRTFASSLTALTLVVTPALAHAQEGWVAVDQTPAAPVPAAPMGPVAMPPPPAPFAPAVPLPQRTEMLSSKLMVGGIIMASIGTAFLIGGVVALEQAQGHGLAGVGSSLAGVMATFFGDTLIVPGDIMTGVGASPVPARRGGEQPTVSLGPGSARLTWSF
jgi:hypothetical protein